MIWLQLKQGGAILLGGLNLVLLAWAFRTHFKRSSLPDGYYKLLPWSPLVAALQLAVGLSFLVRGWQVAGMHLFYATMIGLGALSQFLLRRNTAAGHRYRARPAVHGFIALFVTLLTTRAWMSG